MRPRWWTLRSDATTAPSSRARSIEALHHLRPDPLPVSHAAVEQHHRAAVARHESTARCSGDAVPFVMLWT